MCYTFLKLSFIPTRYDYIVSNYNSIRENDNGFNKVFFNREKKKN